MKNTIKYTVLVFMILYGKLFAQHENIALSFLPMYGNEKIVISDSSFKVENNNDLQIDALKFYISKIQFLKNGQLVFEEKNSFHLLDASIEKTMNLSVEKNHPDLFDAIRFNIGIDSVINTSGVMGGDLDPTKGMYWAWQSGYINFKIEGKSALCNTRNHEFHFHLGGYQYPFDCLQTITLLVGKSNRIKIKIDIKSFLQQIDLSQENKIMSPSDKAVKLSKQLGTIFSLIN